MARSVQSSGLLWWQYEPRDGSAAHWLQKKQKNKIHVNDISDISLFLQREKYVHSLNTFFLFYNILHAYSLGENIWLDVIHGEHGAASIWRTQPETPASSLDEPFKILIRSSLKMLREYWNTFIRWEFDAPCIILYTFWLSTIIWSRDGPISGCSRVL